jgi:hypothetical protein
MPRRNRPQIAILSTTPLLITESATEFDCIRDAFNEEIKPRGIIEQMYAADIAYLTWEIIRLRRCKAVIINAAFRVALVDLLKQLLREPRQQTYQVANEADDLACAWFTDKDVKKQVSELLSQFQLDESAIEAQAIQQSSEDLEQLDRLLASLESRRNKALRSIAEYRGGFAGQLRESSDRIIEGKVLRLEHGSSKKPSAAA